MNDWREEERLPDGRVLTYPPLSKEEREVLKVLSGGRGLCISRYSLSKAYYDAKGGKLERMRELVRRLSKLPALELLEAELVDPEEMPK